MVDKYRYGIFNKINKTNGWNETQIKMWMDKNGIDYKNWDKKDSLVQRIKDAGYK